MKKLTWVALLWPMLAAAAPQAAGAPAGDAERAARAGHPLEQKMRLARVIGLADALQLDDAAALRVRDVLARYDEKRAPLREQARQAFRIVRDAAHGDQAAAGQVDAALQRARDARGKLRQLDAQMLDEVTKGAAPERKARAAMLLARFQRHAQRFAAARGRHGWGGHGGGSHEGGPGRPGMHEPGAEHGMLEPGHDPGEEHAAGAVGDDELAGDF